jgi:hypothetical protein
MVYFSCLATWLLYFVILFSSFALFDEEKLNLLKLIYWDGVSFMLCYSLLKLIFFQGRAVLHYVGILIYSLILYVIFYGLSNPLMLFTSFLRPPLTNTLYHTLIIIFLWEKKGWEIFK